MNCSGVGRNRVQKCARTNEKRAFKYCSNWKSVAMISARLFIANALVAAPRCIIVQLPFSRQYAGTSAFSQVAWGLLGSSVFARGSLPFSTSFPIRDSKEWQTCFLDKSAPGLIAESALAILSVCIIVLLPHSRRYANVSAFPQVATGLLDSSVSGRGCLPFSTLFPMRVSKERRSCLGCPI